MMPITISEISDEDLNIWIATQLEPLSSLPNADECDKQDMDNFPTECWIASFRMSRIALMHVPSWEPRDMVNDPAMTVMLLEKLASGDFVRSRSLERIREAMARVVWDKISVGRAVAQAFALSLGWGSEGSGVGG